MGAASSSNQTAEPVSTGNTLEPSLDVAIPAEMQIANSDHPDHTQASRSLLISSRPRKKSKKLPRNNACTALPNLLRPCYIAGLPLEMLAEVLSHVPPPSILFLARSSKYFFTTLVKNPTATFIWKRARLYAYPLQVPDPPPIWSEPAYAEFIWGPKECEICHRRTYKFHESYALRAALCGETKCRKKWLKQSIVPGDHAAHVGLPYLELGCRLENERPPLLSRTALRRSDDAKYLQLVDEYSKNPADFAEKHKTELIRARILHQHAINLTNWIGMIERLFTKGKELSSERASKFSDENGWTLQELEATPSYQNVFKRRICACQFVTTKEVEHIRAKVDTEIIAARGRRFRKAAEKAYLERVEVIAKFHAQLRDPRHALPPPEKRMRRGGGTIMPKALVLPLVIPTLSEFRKLPLIAVIEGTPSTIPPPVPEKYRSAAKALIGELRDSAVLRSNLAAALREWETRLREQLLARMNLGLEAGKWKTGDRRVVHPTARPSARWVCSSCTEKSEKIKATMTLTFKDVCAHQCKHGVGWTIENFVVDFKAKEVLTQALTLLGFGENEVVNPIVIEKHRFHFLCLSCSGLVVMNFDMLASHSKRHEKMVVGIIDPASIHAVSTKYTVVDLGLCERLAAQRSQKDVQEKRVSEKYRCRHCIHHLTTVREKCGILDGFARVAESSSAGRPEERFSFDGLQRHLKARHGVEYIGDEDLFCFTEGT